MGQGFVNLFLDTSVIAWIVLIASLACLIAEIFIPKFGLVGIGGIILAVAGTVFNCTKPWLSAGDIIWLILDTLILFGVCIGLVYLGLFLWKKYRKSTRKGPAYIEMDGKKIPADKMGNPDFSFLKGKAGTCVTDLNPSGKVEIEGEIYNVLSVKNYLYNGNMVRVVKTVGASIYVQKI